MKRATGSRGSVAQRAARDGLLASRLDALNEVVEELKRKEICDGREE